MIKGEKTFELHIAVGNNTSWKFTVFTLFLQCLIAFLIYGNTLSNQFVFDDLPLVVENQQIRHIKNIPVILGLKTGRPIYRPVRYLTYMLDYAISGTDPVGYHVSNILYHVTASFILFLILTAILRNIYAAFAGSVIFLVHPVQTDSVSYIAGRRDILTALFSLLGFFFFVKYRQSKRKYYPVLTIVCFILALGSKEMAVTLPIICLLYDFTLSFNMANSNYASVLQKSAAAFWNILKKYWGIYAPLMAVGLFFFFYKVFFYYPSLRREFYGGGAAGNFATVLRVVCHYLKLLFFPIVLNADYSYNAFPVSKSFLEIRVIGAAFILCVILYGVFVSLKKQKWLFFGGIWFFITLMPVCQIFPHHELMAEHYLYLPSAGFVIVAALFLEYLSLKRKRAAVVFFMGLVILFSIRTVERNRDWRDPMTLWTSVLKVAPQCARACSNIGNEYLKQKAYQKAISYYKQAVALRPNHAIFHNNLGEAYGVAGQEEKARHEIEKALELDPRLAEANNNMGIVYYQEGDYQKAGEFFWKSLKRKKSAKAFFNYAKCMTKLGKTNEAAKALKRAVKRKPNYAEAYHQLGILYREKGDYKSALNSFEMAIALRPDYAEAYFNIGNIYFYDMKSFNKAIDAYQRGLKINPKVLGAYKNLAALYFTIGDYLKAAKTYENAFREGFKDSDLYYNTALLYGKKTGDPKKALFYLQKALHLAEKPLQKKRIKKAINYMKGLQ